MRSVLMRTLGSVAVLGLLAFGSLQVQAEQLIGLDLGAVGLLSFGRRCRKQVA